MRLILKVWRWNIAAKYNRYVITDPTRFQDHRHRPLGHPSAVNSPHVRIMNLDFSGKTAIVTGAAHGFGRAISLALAERGAHVWAVDVLEEELHETEAICSGATGSCRARVGDVRDRAAVEPASPPRLRQRAAWTSSSTTPAECSVRWVGRSSRLRPSNG